MSQNKQETVKELLEKFRSGFYIESEYNWSLAKMACTDRWCEVLRDLPPEELQRFRAWARRSFQGPDVKMLVIGSGRRPTYTDEQAEFLDHFGREEDDKD